MRIDVKEAVAAAKESLLFLQNVVEPTTLTELRLEEVELSEDGYYWLVTLGYDRPVTKSTSPLSQLMSDARREYKLFKVRVETGEVESMKIRQV